MVQYAYDIMDRVTNISWRTASGAALGGFAYAYDSLGRKISHIDGRGNTTRTEYDAAGRKSANNDALGNRTTYAYNQFGSLAAVTNPLGNAVVYEYDLRGRKTYEGGATYPVRYTYDVFGNKTTMMTYRDESRGPDSGDVTTWLYDEASGLVTNKVYADGLGPRYEYDASGRLAKRTWARGIDTFYAYDGWGNLANTTYSDDTPTVSLRYDALGRQVEAHDAAGVTTFAYDAFGANTNETVVGVAGTNVLERFTDEFGRDVGYALNGERRTVIGRDLATGRIKTMLTAGCTNAFVWTYLSGCDLKHRLLYPNGALVTWEYEPHRDLMTLVSNDVYSTFLYAYDAAGKRVSNNDERYVYNVRGELILATNVVTGAEFIYRYDDIGNRLWSREFGTNCTYVANELNQYTNIVRGGVFELSAFDLDGNQTNIVTSTGEWAVTYNGENRPVRWHRAADDTTIRMAYDRMGRRVVKNDETFVYDNFLNIGKTIWDPTEPIATRPLLSKMTQHLCYYVFDGNKNVSAIVSEGCVDIAHYMYSPFGHCISQQGMIQQDELFKFSSEVFDRDVGLIVYAYRMLNPLFGKWEKRDPYYSIDFARLKELDVRDISSSTAGNEESFCLNDPINATDYLGLLNVLCKCGTIAPESGTTVGSRLNGNYCRGDTLGNFFEVEHEWDCIAASLFTDVDRIECYCSQRKCTQKISYFCSRWYAAAILVYSWVVSGSSTSGCYGN